MSGNTRIEAQATMLNQFLRTQRLFHREDMEKLYQGRAAGGGIGGVGEFGLIDDGRGCRTSVNRHTFATRKTVGQKAWKR
jgi:tRNA A37 threonylcarbamoyladenosine dehydratase